MTKWQALWKTIRPLNLLIMALTMWGVYLAMICQYSGLVSSPALLLLLTFSIVLLAAGGNLLNDIEDVKVDAINKPGENLIDSVISPERGLNYYAILTLSGLLTGLIFSWIAHDSTIFLLLLFIAGSLWYYSRYMQKQVLIGNFIVALLCGLLPIIVLLFQRHMVVIPVCGTGGVNQEIVNQMADRIRMNSLLATIAIVYSVFAFLLTFIREIIKDIEDMHGDGQEGYRTFAIAYGFSSSRMLGIVFGLVTLVFECLVIYMLMVSEHSIQVHAIPVFVLAVAPIMAVIHQIIGMKKISDAKRVSRFLKITMALGLSTCLFFAFL